MKTKRSYVDVLPLALSLLDKLKPACHRIEIAGSLRRKVAMIGDIELVAVPILDVNLFGEAGFASQLNQLLDSWPLRWNQNKKGKRLRDGDKWKEFYFVSSTGQEYQVDLFLQPDPATWGVNYMIRTGSAEFSRKMVSAKRIRGYMPDRFRVRGGRVFDGRDVMDTPEEGDIFKLWGMKYVLPENR